MSTSTVGDDTKQCSRCRRALPTVAFHKDSSKNDGCYPICKECRAGISHPPVVPDGYRMCRRCDRTLPLSEYYPAGEGHTRHTCKDCCDGRWKTSRRARPGRFPAHYVKSLWGYLPDSEQVALRRNDPKIKERIRENGRRYNNSEHGKQKRKEWMEANHTRMAIHEHKRRAKKAVLRHEFTPQDWALTLDAFHNRCVYCGANGGALEQDHWLPVARGGDYIIGNIVPSCKPCNCKKRNKMPQDFCSPNLYYEITQVLTRLKDESNGE